MVMRCVSDENSLPPRQASTFTAVAEWLPEHRFPKRRLTSEDKAFLEYEPSFPKPGSHWRMVRSGKPDRCGKRSQVDRNRRTPCLRDIDLNHGTAGEVVAYFHSIRVPEPLNEPVRGRQRNPKNRQKRQKSGEEHESIPCGSGSCDCSQPGIGRGQRLEFQDHSLPLYAEVRDQRHDATWSGVRRAQVLGCNLEARLCLHGGRRGQQGQMEHCDRSHVHQLVGG